MPEPTLTELLTLLRDIETKLPNGELQHIRNDVDDLRSYFKDIKEDMSDLKAKLLNPESGVIVKTNRNQEKIELTEDIVEALKTKTDKLDLDVRDLKIYKKNVNSAMYVVYAATVGLLINALKDMFG